MIQSEIIIEQFNKVTKIFIKYYNNRVNSILIVVTNRYFGQRKKDLQEDLQQAGGDQSKVTSIQDRISKLDKPVSATSTWDDFGLDPLDRVEVLLAVEEEFGVIIPDDTSNAIENVSQTIEFMNSEGAAKATEGAAA